MQRKSLSDILRNGEASSLRDAWSRTEAADDLLPLPAGEYVCHVADGEPFASRQNVTPGYKLTFKVIEGEHTGRLLWHDVWLTPAALPMTKRDLGKLGVSSLDQLEQPLPRGIRCRVRVALRTEDDGSTFNRVKTFDVIGIDEPARDEFAPADGNDAATDATPF